jgi:hypothetical protein
MSTPEQNLYLQKAFGISPNAFSGVVAVASADDGATGPGGPHDSDAKTNAAPAKPPASISSGNIAPKGPNSPDLTDQQEADEDMQMAWFRDTYDAALQGVSGKYPEADKATEAARAIAEEAIKTQPRRMADLAKAQREDSLNTYKKFFYEAIQGLASGADTAPNAIVMKAHAMAMRSLEMEKEEKERLEWRAATLPQPMASSCKPQSGKVKGPKNHVLCTTHQHVIDIETKMVIAHSVEEYTATASKK